MTGPTLADFHHDCNEHALAHYKKIGEGYVVELDSLPGGWRVLIWEAVTDEQGEFVDPEPHTDNRYAWDIGGEWEFGDKTDAMAEYVRLGASVEKVRSFITDHPYDGARSPYAERMEEA